MIKTIIKFIGNIALGLLIILFVLSIFLSMRTQKNKDEIPSIFGLIPMTVLSGSMEPSIKPGDIIIDNNSNKQNVKIGDIVTYRVNSDMLVTHRVIEIVDQSGDIFFITKGDANNIEDENLVSQDKIIGKYLFRIPYGGYIQGVIKGRIGFTLFILIPSVFLIIEQFKDTKQETKGLKRDKNFRNDITK